MKYHTFAPMFDGFYNTVFQYDRESEDIEQYNEQHGTNLEFDDFDFDYRDYERRVATAFVNRLETELKQFLPSIRIEFEQVRSPKYYNFTNDSIDIEVKLNLRQLIKLIADRKEAAAQYFKDVYTSRSGFMSFHSNDINDWLNVKYIKENTAHRVGALLECLCSIELDKDDTLYWVDGEFWINIQPVEKV